MINENATLLEEIYQATKMGLEATQLIIPKIQNPRLRTEIEDQALRYQDMGAKAKRMLHADGRMPGAEKTMQKAMLRGSIRINTMVDQTPSHIARLMMNGTAMGIKGITKNLNRLDGADTEVKKLAEDYIINEQKNIDELKKHL
ncbi:hypothetical protein [Caproiciproducens sp. CPB-2]|uniref:hypothetical protein n=1 Tax=Caproiciproducens sp. CPB-2 TaxID=3030017 RepID=UPI0023DC2F51|nr:hypothetical protein [Caproiciproducens sp. CPB-2]MDF1495912.1 hypothetical protein [Caproiciproducens sp. CPB-2]